MAYFNIKYSLAQLMAIGTIFVASVALATNDTGQSCLIPPAYDPGIGSVYFCSPDEGERYLINHARSGQTEVGLSEDVWVNFHGVFNNQVWVNIGLQETGNASLPALDAVVSLLQWMQSIKNGHADSLDAFLAPIELSATYSPVDVALREQLLRELKDTVLLPREAKIRATVYHVHLMPSNAFERVQEFPFNPMLSLPSSEDLLQIPLLNKVAPESEFKIAVAAGIWTYALNERQAARFVNSFYQGPPEIPFHVKFKQAYHHYVKQAHLKSGLNEVTKFTHDHVNDFTRALRQTGAKLRFTFATDWATFQR